MVSAKRALVRIVFGSRYDEVPGGLTVYVRPGERYIRQGQWWVRLHTSRAIELDEFRARVPLGEIEEFISCALCGESRQQPLFRPAAKSEEGEEIWAYNVVRCPSCGFLYRNPNVRPERLGDLYATGYSDFLRGEYARNRQRRYRLTMAAFDPVFSDGSGQRLLDFGCGAGLFLELAEQAGFDACGVDLSADSVERANQQLTKARAYVGGPAEVPEVATGDFDVLTLWSVLAHLPRPIEDFAGFRRLLAPAGVLLVLTVNADSLMMKADGSGWNGFTPNHLMFYSRQTLPALLRHAGFAGVAFAPFYGDTIEDGTAELPDRLRRRLLRAVEATDGGNMMRALAFADEQAISRWGEHMHVRRFA